MKKHPNWSIVYEEAISDDGELWFPERLSAEFLTDAKKLMGTRIFANQYLNQIFPAEDAVFKEAWFKYYTTLPAVVNTIVFIDPAISQEDGADYTGISVISVDCDQNWYVRVARRERLTPPQIINLGFELYKTFHPSVIGIEDVAYQKALLYMFHEEMKRRGQYLPLSGINHGNDRSKEMRISGALVPRMEWGFIWFPLGESMDHLKREMLQFPAAAHDDILDSLASCESIITYPNKPKGAQINEEFAHHPNYERNIIKQLSERANEDL